MNKNILIILVIVIVAAGGWYFVSAQKKSGDSMNTMKMEPTKTAAQPTPTGAMDEKSSSSSAEKEITVEGGAFYFKPNEIKVKKGEKVKLTFTNAGGMHDFVVDELNVKTDVIGSGKSTTVEFTPDKTGTFEFYCSVGNHRQMGMKGKITVE
jgi:cytochrome c oxidase subunit 2